MDSQILLEKRVCLRGAFFMKSAQFKYCFVIFQLILLSACTPQSTPTAVPTAAPIDLAGPVMAVGSSFLYADGTVLVPVPAGPFTMGNDGPDNPKHQVTLADFWIYSTKVTNGQYAYCVSTGVCTPPLQSDNPGFSDPLHVSDPMVGVDYGQASAYCGFVHGRLPTEAEWEKTARGPGGNIFPWGDGTPNCDLLNYDVCVGKTTPVNNYPGGKSYYHALDMEGNALEWVADWYRPDYYLNSPTDNPQGPDKSQARSVRSSAFNSGANQTQAYNRFYSPPGIHRNNLSFRCVVDDPTYFAPFCTYPATYGTEGIGGSTGGSQPEVNCPNLVINQDQECQGTTPITYVTFPGSDVHYQPACQEDPAVPGKYDCTSDGKLVVCGNCSVTVKSPPQCPRGYTYDQASQNCVGPGGSGACLTGFTSQPTFTRGIRTSQQPLVTPESGVPTGQCCAFTPPVLDNTFIQGGSNLVCEAVTPNSRLLTCHVPFSACPAGTTFDGQNCISTVLQPFCKIEGVSLNSCTSGGGGGDTKKCPNSCGQNYIQNPTTCECICNGC
jgi:formylglycine-generating enzyme required for sulfatase activity